MENEKMSGEEWQRKMILLKTLMDTEKCVIHDKSAFNVKIGNGTDVHWDGCCEDFNDVLSKKIDLIQKN